jgi:small subunit ribosomal protein S18
MAEAQKKRLPMFPSLTALVGKKPTVFAPKQCPLSHEGGPAVTYKNPAFLRRFTTERGKLIPTRMSSISCKNQRQLKREIKRARFLALMPYIAQD